MPQDDFEQSFLPCGSHRLHRGLPNSRLRIVPGAPHMPFYERADIYFPAVEGSLAGLDGMGA